MATFKVGQRVACARPMLPKNKGMEGIFLAYVDDVICEVDWRGQWHSNIALVNQLEPIIPEGMQPCTWEECLWQPAKNVVSVEV